MDFQNSQELFVPESGKGMDPQDGLGEPHKSGEEDNNIYHHPLQDSERWKLISHVSKTLQATCDVINANL